MKNTKPIIPFFHQFIRDTETGKRLKKNGERIKPQSVENYKYVLRNLVAFSTDTGFELRICDAGKLNAREHQAEKNYWKKFYRNFTAYLYKNGCHDNYVGANVKVVRVFFNYLKNDRDFNTGDFQRLFYVRKEEIDILVLSPDQLRFLINDKDFESRLSPALRRIKDIFVFGCLTGLRYSDLFLLTGRNFERTDGGHYLKLKTKKTKTYTSIKLPVFATDILARYQKKDAKAFLFSPISLFNFNKGIKQLGESAGFTGAVEVSRERQGKAVPNRKASGKERFCDKMSSHMMRRTAITTMLILGMPEHMVRKVSGHSHASSSFNRYVHYAQVYLDREIEQIHEKLKI